MASIDIVLRYGSHEASVEVPLRVDIPEVLRRVRLKRGGRPHEETANQIADDIRERIFDQKLVREMVKEIVAKIDALVGVRGFEPPV